MSIAPQPKTPKAPSGRNVCAWEGASPSLAELPANNESNCERVMARGEQLEVNRQPVEVMRLIAHDTNSIRPDATDETAHNERNPKNR